MGVVSVKERKDSGTAKQSFANRKVTVTHTRIFIVRMSSKLDDGHTVLLSSQIPAIGDIYQSGNGIDSFNFCQSREARRDTSDKAGKTWMVTVEYSNSFDPNQSQGNPILRPAVYNFQGAQFEAIFTKDIDGVAVVNGAGDAYDPPATIDDSRVELVATKNFDATTLPQLILLAAQYKNSVNSDTFYGATEAQAKMMSIVSGGLQIESIDNQTYRYYPVTFTIGFKTGDETWDLDILEQGWNYIDQTVSNTKIAFKDQTENLAKTLLYGKDTTQGVAGFYIAHSLIKNGSKHAEYTRWKAYKRMPFSALGL